MLIIRWLGQACFLLSTLTGTHVLIDPPNPQVGYHIAAHGIPARAVFVSHEHPDHNYTDAARPDTWARPGSGMDHVDVVTPLSGPEEVRGEAIAGHGAHPGAFDYKYRRIFAYHDNVQGKQRGPDTITVLETNGLRICHLGDLGQLALTPEQVKEIGRVDVLMIPVGGFFTIDGPQAAAVAGQLRPRVILPMHYQTAALNPSLRARLAPPDAFLAAMKGRAAVVHLAARDLTLSPRTLPRTPTIYLLRYQ